MSSDKIQAGTMAPDPMLRARLRELYDDYFACLEDQDLERWPGFFVEDGFYSVQSSDNHDNGLPICDIFCDSAAMMRDRAAALRATSVFEARRLRHFPGALRIRTQDVDGTIHTQLSYLAIESIVGDPPTVFSAGRSIDEIVDLGTRLRFRSRRVIYDHSYIRNSLVFPL